MPRPRRSFPAEFKAQIVLQLLSGEASQAELCRKHSLKPNLIANWKAAVLDRLHTVFEAEGVPNVDHLRPGGLQRSGVPVPLQTAKPSLHCLESFRPGFTWEPP